MDAIEKYYALWKSLRVRENLKPNEQEKINPLKETEDFDAV